LSENGEPEFDEQDLDPGVYDQVLELLRKLPPDERKRAFAAIRKEREAKEQDKIRELALLPNSHWSRAHVLRRLPNPTKEAYEQKIHIPELTFVGTANQPDFGEVLLTFYPGDYSIELKSLKQYKDEFRQCMASYERLANVMFEDLMTVYGPKRLRLMMRLRPRGGISSALTIDSDWKIRGGREEFNDWRDNTDRFGFEMRSNPTQIW
jgi:7-cyano-7-deazaguanine reductase